MNKILKESKVKIINKKTFEENLREEIIFEDKQAELPTFKDWLQEYKMEAVK